MAIDRLFRERRSAGADFDQLCVTYFVKAHKYCLNKKAIQTLVEAFNEKGCDIVQLVDKMSPFGFKYEPYQESEQEEITSSD